MSTRINYTAAELRSFDLQPETCAIVDAAVDEAFKPPSLDAPGVDKILLFYGLDPADKKLRLAIAEVMMCAAFPVKARLSSIIMHRATFPLRAALIEQVKAQMAAAGEPTDPRNHFNEWIESWERSEAKRIERSKDIQP